MRVQAPARLQIVRQLTPDLQARIDTLGRAARDADGGVSPFGEHKWLRLVRGDDRCTALLLWDASDALLLAAAHCDAYHTSAPNRPCRLTAEMVVNPEYRDSGLGSRVLAEITDLAVDEGAGEAHLWAYGNLDSARRLAAAFDFTPERTLLEYCLPPADLPERAEVELRAFRPEHDAQAWLELHNRVFGGHPEQGSWDMSDLAARMQQGWFDPRDLLLLEDEAGLLAFCWTKLPRDETAPGEIYIVGVDPRGRGRGLGRQLTVAGLAHIRARGRPGVTLFVESDNHAALRLYEGLGFRKKWEHVCYRRALA
jgi:mycothiol synthase